MPDIWDCLTFKLLACLLYFQAITAFLKKNLSDNLMFK